MTHCSLLLTFTFCSNDRMTEHWSNSCCPSSLVIMNTNSWLVSARLNSYRDDRGHTRAFICLESLNFCIFFLINRNIGTKKKKMERDQGWSLRVRSKVIMMMWFDRIYIRMIISNNIVHSTGIHSSVTTMIWPCYCCLSTPLR
jgi:hypothetical protein